MLLVSGLAACSVAELLRKYGLSIELVPGGHSSGPSIVPCWTTSNGSFWGEPEAGIVSDQVLVRDDTPIHSPLHETSHIVCMTPARRSKLKGDAGGGDLEECAVCYLQVVLANELPGAGRARLMQDMDDWAYSFRLGSTGAGMKRTPKMPGHGSKGTAFFSPTDVRDSAFAKRELAVQTGPCAVSVGTRWSPP